MKFLQRLIGIVSLSDLNESLDEIVAELEYNRNKIRKEVFEEMEKINVSKEGEKLQKLLIQMNRDIAASYEKETVLRDFISKLNK